MDARLSILPAFLLAFAPLTSAIAQERPDIFANPENLQALPEDISRDDLRATMRGFTRALDLRCSSCHVGEEDQSIFDYDFAADDKELKLIAREMIKLVQDINTSVTEIERGKNHQHTKVTCVTCHRGQNKPLMIEDILAEDYEEGGVNRLVSHYRELREKHYGGFTYDFSAERLGSVGRSLTPSSLDDALIVHNLNVTLNPNAAAAYVGRGQAYQQLERLQEALDDYNKAIELDPDYAFLGPAIKQIESKIAE